MTKETDNTASKKLLAYFFLVKEKNLHLFTPESIIV